MNNILIDLTEKYFENFKNKNLNVLNEIFDDNIKLYDPFVKNVIGKQNVLKITKGILDSCEEIKFTQQDIFVDVQKMTTVSEIEFYCGKIRINVVDIIKFSNQNKIISITAYLDTAFRQ